MPDSSKLAPVKAAARRQFDAMPGRVATVRRRVAAMEPVHRRRLAVAGGGLLLLLILIVLVAGGGGDEDPVDLSRDATPIRAPAFSPTVQRVTTELDTLAAEVRALLEAGPTARSGAATQASDIARGADVELSRVEPPAGATDEVEDAGRVLTTAGRSLDALAIAVSAEQLDRVERARTRLTAVLPDIDRTNAALKLVAGG